MDMISELALRAWARVSTQDDGAAGMLVVGILIGVGLVIFGIIKFLIPGE